MTQTKAERGLIQITHGSATMDGAGVRLTRLIGASNLPMVDPFLLFDHFGSERPNDYIAGFPDHPHRGFVTVTYMLAGRMRHKDSAGFEDVIGPGDMQWMTAGAGLVHSEMPEQEEGMMSGFQLWVNLPAAEKMTPPTYRGIKAAQVPIEESPGCTIKVLAGSTDQGTVGAFRIATVTPLFFDIFLRPNARFRQAVAASHQGFVYCIDGSVRVGASDPLSANELGVLGAGTTLEIRSGQSTARCLLVAGRALGEPVARYGPFVMNTRQEILQAINDYQSGHF